MYRVSGWGREVAVLAPTYTCLTEDAIFLPGYLWMPCIPLEMITCRLGMTNGSRATSERRLWLGGGLMPPKLLQPVVYPMYLQPTGLEG